MVAMVAVPPPPAPLLCLPPPATQPAVVEFAPPLPAVPVDVVVVDVVVVDVVVVDVGSLATLVSVGTVPGSVAGGLPAAPADPEPVLQVPPVPPPKPWFPPRLVPPPSIVVGVVSVVGVVGVVGVVATPWPLFNPVPAALVSTWCLPDDLLRVVDAPDSDSVDKAECEPW